MVSGSRPRNSPDEYGVVRVGERRQGGQLMAVLRRTEQGERLLVTAAQMTGVQIALTRADAIALYRGLGRLLGLE